MLVRWSLGRVSRSQSSPLSTNRTSMAVQAVVKDARLLLYLLQHTYLQYYLDGWYSRRDRHPSGQQTRWRQSTTGELLNKRCSRQYYSYNLKSNRHELALIDKGLDKRRMMRLDCNMRSWRSSLRLVVQSNMVFIMSLQYAWTNGIL